jgi:hypothetical protein
VGAAGITLVASAMLTSLVPPALVQAAPRQPPPPRLVAQSGGAAQGAVAASRASLEVSPGYPGQNRFSVHVSDPAARGAVDAQVTLRFEMPSRPEQEATTLALQRAADGSYSGLGANLSLIGDWVVTAVVEQGARSIELPFQVTCRPSPDQLQQMTMGRMPMVYGLHLADGSSLEAYLTPGRPGRNTLHLIFTDQRNAPVSVPGSPAVTARQGRLARTPEILRLGYGTPTPNHFYAVESFTTGRWDFHLVAAAPAGGRIDTTFPLTIGP